MGNSIAYNVRKISEVRPLRATNATRKAGIFFMSNREPWWHCEQEMLCSEEVQEEKAHCVECMDQDEEKTRGGKTRQEARVSKYLKWVSRCVSTTILICGKKAKEEAKNRSWAE